MKSYKPVYFNLPIFILLFSMIFGTAGSTGGAATAGAVVDPRVWEDTAGGQTGSFLVLLREQAASSFQSQHKVESAYANLTRVAEATQPAVVARLKQLSSNPSLEISYRAFWLVNALVVRGKRQVVEALQEIPEVAEIEANRAFRVPLENVDPGSVNAFQSTSIEWNINLVNAPVLWNLGYSGQGVVYANADTGVYWQHPALKQQYRGWNAAIGTADHNYNWYDAIHNASATNSCGSDSKIPCDDYGHGTHVMGTGVGFDGVDHIGMAPGAKWIACRNMDDGVGTPSTYIECLQFFVAPTDLSGNNPKPSLHADVISNSYSCPVSEGCTDVHVLQQAVEQVRAAGIFMSVSAGNSGSACATINEPPGLEADVFTVGASGFQTTTIASFSSRGPVTIDGSNRMKPNITAPGERVFSSINGGGYGTMSGTSMAAPHVAGAVALLWSAYPDLRGKVGLTELILRGSTIHETTSQQCGSDLAGAWPNNVYGYGFLDVEAAYSLKPLIQSFFFPLVYR